MIYLATHKGVVAADRGAEWHVLQHGLEGRRVTSLAANGNVILAGTLDGIFRSEDGGRSWHDSSRGLSLRHLRWMAALPGQADGFLAGTEPAGIFTSRDGGSSWHEAAEVGRLRDQFHWFLPYSPEAGCVRGFALQGERAYAAVEVGGVLRSADGGLNWQLAQGSDGSPSFGQVPASLVHPDVHSILVHPSSPDLVDAPTGGGFYRSNDGGKTWRCLYRCYCRAAWVDPADPAHILLGPADGVDANGRIEESQDGGETWRLASRGLAVPWRRHMVERFLQLGDELMAVLSNGEVLCAPLATLNWRPVLAEINGVNAVALSPVTQN